MTEPPIRTWPVWLLGAPAAVAIWSGWVGLGQMTGFGVIHPLPGTPLESWELDTAITLPIGMEVYAAYALWVWLSRQAPPAAARFARLSAIGALCLGAAGQVAYHLMAAAGWTTAPWWITTVVACLPVAVLGMGAALRHLIHAEPFVAPVAAPEQVPAVASSPAPGGPETAVPGDGGETPPAAPPRGRSTKPPVKRPAKPSRDVVLAEYVAKVVASGGTPIPADALHLVRARTGRGMRDQALREALRNLTDEAAGRTAAAIPEGGGAVNGRTPGAIPGGVHA